MFRNILEEMVGLPLFIEEIFGMPQKESAFGRISMAGTSSLH